MVAIRCRAYLSTHGLALAYGVSDGTAARWCRQGRVAGAELVRVGRYGYGRLPRWRIPPEALSPEAIERLEVALVRA